MTLLEHRLSLVAVVAAAAVFSLAACQDRKSPVPPPAPASSGEYSVPSSDSKKSSDATVAVPGQGADVAAKGTETGMVGGASGTVGSGGKAGSGSTSSAGTGAAVSSESTIVTKK